VLLARPATPELVTHLSPRPLGLAGGVPTAFTGLEGDHPEAVLVDDASILPPDAVVVGPLVWDRGEPAQGEGTVIVVPWCPSPGSPPPVPAPSPAEIWEQTPLPRAPVAASPPGTAGWPGITRLATRVWSDAREPATAAVTLRGFSAVVTATPIAYAWSFGDGSTAVVASPPAAVTFTRRGDYRVTLFVVWEGRARISYPEWGLEVGDIDLGTVTIPEALPYHVAEIRSVLRTLPKGR
jgi:hypothetical protein